MNEIKHLLRIRAPVEKVFEAINTASGLKGWWVSDCSGDFAENSTIEIGFGKHGSGKLKIVKLVDNREVEWYAEDEDMWKDTKISFRLELEGENTTIVRFRHFGWPGDVKVEELANNNYNWGRFLFSLKTFVERGEGFPVGGKI